ncbi:radical SAM protein [Rhabdochromatium marinum]|uniref:radical SAM protein n=1 Tax=Rhabdochromatium marinum TaxID=48729 RepID=UPI001902FF73|nr:radical SAM protein [Rhabdochromatium marinum]
MLFLSDSAQEIWVRLLNHKDWKLEDIDVLQRLSTLGFVDNGYPKNTIPEKVSSKSITIQPSPSSAINLWSFRNNIPLSGHFELTGRCNLRCRHCYCTFKEKQDKLSTQDVFHIIDDLHDAGTLGLVLTGGEIFTRPDIEEILLYLQERGFIIRINTNGTLIKPQTLHLIAALTNIYRIHVSLYGADADIHDAITKVKGSFKKTQASLIALKDAGHDVRVNCSILRTNVASYQDVRTKIGDSLGIPVRFDPFIFPKDDGSLDNLSEMISEEMLAEYDLYNERTETLEPKKPKLCKAAFSFFSIDETGKVYPCLKMKKSMRCPLGTVPQQRFIDIWKSSKQVQEIRVKLENRLRNCSVCDLDI